MSLNNIGENFASLKDFDKCRYYVLQAIAINMELKAGRGIAINYELLQRCDLDQGLLADAKKNLDIGMPYALEARENYILSQYYLGYGKLQALNNHNDSAIYYFNRAVTSARLKAICGMNSRSIWLKQNTWNIFRPGKKYPFFPKQ